MAELNKQSRVWDGYVWEEIPDPCEMRVLPSEPFDMACDILDGREVSPIRLAKVLKISPRAVVAYDAETERWYQRKRKASKRAMQGGLNG